MRFATRISPGKGTGSEGDPREQESAEIIDLASRAAFPAVADRKARGDGLGLAAGVAVVFGIGALTFWAMEAARAPEPATIGNPNLAPPPPAAPPAVLVPESAGGGPCPDDPGARAGGSRAAAGARQ
ncbi:MAG: hypothetical protein ACJLS3_00070 [Erythrobacter sp.]